MRIFRLASVLALALLPTGAFAGDFATEALIRTIGVERQEQAAFLEYCQCTVATAPSPEDIVSHLHEGLRAAKNAEEVESVRLYCTDSIAAHSFAERDRLNILALGSLRAGRADEANALLKKVASIAELDRNLAERTCKL